MSIGSKIKDLCADHDMTQWQLAKVIGIAPHSLYGYASDKCYPNAEVLHDIAKFFGVKMEYFWDE